MSLTSDPEDPRLTHGADTAPTDQAPVYLVLSEEERAKGFVRPLRRAYVHYFWKDGSTDRVVPKFLVTIDDPRYDEIGGCGALTTMGLALCETYARDPKFYGATYCVGCRMHRPVAEFRWDEDGAVVGS
jgi:hypothetical protein